MKPQGALYSDARQEADIHDDSKTEVSVSLLSEDGDKQRQWERADIEAGRPTTQPSRCTRICSFFRRWRGIVDTLMLFVIVGLLLERRGMQPASRDRRLEPVGDLTGFAPEFTQQITTFHPTTDFVPDDPKKLFTNASIQEKWLSIVPRGLGYVVVRDPAAHDNLPVPLPEFAPRTVFTTSMTHQLHCLYAILEGYAGLVVNGSAAVDMHSHIPDGTKGAEGPWHMQHCFEYLRQAIMCAGDVALEGTQTTFPEGFTGSDGWDAKHVCRDYKQVYDYLDKNRALDDHWI